MKPSKHINLLREFSIPLVAGVVGALAWANISPEGYESFVHAPLLGPFSFHFITNDIFMVFFFGIAAAEIVQSVLPGGDLYPMRRAANPIFATAGGILGPITVYLGFNAAFGSPRLISGWGVPTATDIALAWLAARLIFGSHAAVSFLVLLAIADDAIGLAIIAFFYSSPHQQLAPAWLLMVAAGMLLAFFLRRFQFRSYWTYILTAGVLSWTGLHNAHLHSSLALVFIVPFLPHPLRERKHIFEEDILDVSPLARFEHEWKIIVDFGMLMFGLANAGVPFSFAGFATILVLVSLLVGKTAGIFLAGLLAEKIGFPLPNRVGRVELLIISMIAGVGFTVSVFIAGEAFTDPILQGQEKMGALLSVGIIPIAIIIARVAGVKKRR